MERNKTAVELLIEWISYSSRDTYSVMEHSGYFEEALAKEKQQIKDAYKAGCVDEMWELNNTENEEHYYNKTYANDTTTRLPEENSKRRGWHY